VERSGSDRQRVADVGAGAVRSARWRWRVALLFGPIQLPLPLVRAFDALLAWFGSTTNSASAANARRLLDACFAVLKAGWQAVGGVPPDAVPVIRLDSPWTRYTNGGCFFYKRRDPNEQTLEEPAEGVKEERALGDEEFEKW